MAIILKANKVNLFVSSVLFVFWYHSPNFLDTPRIFSSKQSPTHLRITFHKQRSGDTAAWRYVTIRTPLASSASWRNTNQTENRRQVKQSTGQFYFFAVRRTWRPCLFNFLRSAVQQSVQYSKYREDRLLPPSCSH
jgi:hypothetical protein